MHLQVATGVPMEVWAEQGEQAIATALDILDNRHRPDRHDSEGRQTRG